MSRRRKGFDLSKSNVSAELKAQFQLTSTRSSKITAVPGVGGVTADTLQKKGINTVGDLVDRINSFEDLKNMVSGVNRHRIFDCLDIYLKEKCPQEYEETEVLTRALEDIALVDTSEDQEIAAEVSSCVLS